MHVLQKWAVIAAGRQTLVMPERMLDTAPDGSEVIGIVKAGSANEARQAVLESIKEAKRQRLTHCSICNRVTDPNMGDGKYLCLDCAPDFWS